MSQDSVWENFPDGCLKFEFCRWWKMSLMLHQRLYLFIYLFIYAGQRWCLRSHSFHSCPLMFLLSFYGTDFFAGYLSIFCCCHVVLCGDGSKMVKSNSSSMPCFEECLLLVNSFWEIKLCFRLSRNSSARFSDFFTCPSSGLLYKKESPLHCPYPLVPPPHYYKKPKSNKISNLWE